MIDMGTAADPIEVLLIEDDADVARAVEQGLAGREFAVSGATTMVSGERLIGRHRFQAIVLDLTLPDGDGLALAAGLRASGNDTPILILTARDSVPDRLAGFEQGADDYLGKPFDVNELAARLRVMVRRSGRGEAHLLHYGDLALNLLTRTARRPELEAAGRKSVSSMSPPSSGGLAARAILPISHKNVRASAAVLIFKPPEIRPAYWSATGAAASGPRSPQTPPVAYGATRS